MRSHSTRLVTTVAGLVTGFGGFSGGTQAQTPTDQWQLAAVVYGYFPELRGSATFPTGGPVDITLNPNQIISHLNLAFMGAFEARYGPWGVFTDVMYSKASDSKSQTRSLSIGAAALPANVTANVNLDVQSTLWTLVGSYRLVEVPAASLDLLGGARRLFLDQKLSWQFSADLGPSGPARQGSASSNPNNWDGILGAKGRWRFGNRDAWFVPYYVDVGTGASHLTWQGIAGVGYAFHWGEVIGAWRYIDYQFSSHDASLVMSGPALGVAFHW